MSRCEPARDHGKLAWYFDYLEDTGAAATMVMPGDLDISINEIASRVKVAPANSCGHWPFGETGIYDEATRG